MKYDNNYNVESVKTDNKWFFFICLYLFVDYGRPQDIIPIGIIRPGMITVLILIYYIISSKKIALSKSKQTKYIWYFVILTSLYIPFAVNSYWAYQTTRTLILFVPFILSVIICINSVQRLKKLIIMCLSLMIYIAIYSLLHVGMGSGNYFQDENDLSLYINTWLPFCFFLFQNEKSKYLKLFYAVGLVIGLFAIVISFSRGGFVGLLCMGFVVWLVSPKKIVSLIIICIAALAIYIFSGDVYKNEMSTVTDTKESTAKARLLSWEAGWDMFLDNPLGVGGNNFQMRFPEYQSEEFTRVMWGRVAHSLWFTLLPELGIIGTIIYFLLLYFNIKDIFYIKKQKCTGNDDLAYLHSLSLAFLASLAGYFASATFISVLYYPHYWYITAIIVAATKISMTLNNSNRMTSTSNRKISKYY
ncbi:MAG: O-antigen ligase family protein [Gammaproteobacteria bacterium]|nr:O-antigen ligase family protein [Gammaproteobacteria bacterium]